MNKVISSEHQKRIEKKKVIAMDEILKLFISYCEEHCKKIIFAGVIAAFGGVASYFYRVAEGKYPHLFSAFIGHFIMAMFAAAMGVSGLFYAVKPAVPDMPEIAIVAGCFALGGSKILRMIDDGLPKIIKFFIDKKRAP
jgi:hypothetical protein